MRHAEAVERARRIDDGIHRLLDLLRSSSFSSSPGLPLTSMIEPMAVTMRRALIFDAGQRAVAAAAAHAHLRAQRPAAADRGRPHAHDALFQQAQFRSGMIS